MEEAQTTEHVDIVTRYKPRINYYDALGVTSTAELPEIKNAHHRLARRHLTSGREKIRALNEAYAVLSNPDLRSAYDKARRLPLSQPVAEDKQRKSDDKSRSLPLTKQAFLECLSEDATAYPHSIFPAIAAEPLQVKERLWRLIAANRLSYSDLETSVADRAFLWDLVYRNHSITEHLASGNLQGRFSMQDFTTDYDQPASPSRKNVNWLQASWQELTGSNQPLSEKEKDMLFLLQKFKCCPSVRISPRAIACDFSAKPMASDKVGLYHEGSRLMKSGGRAIVDGVRTYLAQPGRINFSRFVRQMVYRSNVIFNQELTTAVNDQFYLPIQSRLNSLLQKNKAEDQAEITELQRKLQAIEDRLIRGFEGWIQENEKDPEGRWAKEMVKTEGSPYSILLDEIRTLVGMKPEEKKRTTSPVLKEVPGKGVLNQQPSFFQRHPLITSSASVLSLTGIGIGAFALGQYLQGLDPWNWLTTDFGMGTPMDLAIILTGLVVVLLIAAGCLANKMVNRPSSTPNTEKPVLSQPVQPA